MLIREHFFFFFDIYLKESKAEVGRVLCTTCEMKPPGYIRSSHTNPIFLMFSPYFYDIYICH